MQRDSETSKQTGPRVFLTGGTGFVGSYIAVELLKRGSHVIFLARSNDLTAADRIKQIFLWHEYECPESRYTVIEGDLSLPMFGLNIMEYSKLVNAFDEVWHCASDTSFKEEKRARLEKINVEGALTVLNMAKTSGCKVFNYLGTAYVAGKKVGQCDEQLNDQNSFHNVYEETKHKAERMLIDETKKMNMTLNVFRPSIIIGDTEKGKTLLFNTLYHALKILVVLQNFAVQDKKENNGANAELIGITFDEKGEILFPCGS